MSQAYWEGQRAKAVDDLFQTGADFANDWAARREQKRAEAQFRADQAQALQAAKRTGKIDPRFQRTILEDDAAAQIGLKAILLRELAKAVPDHPLVKSQACRESVANVTLLKFNIADRPANIYFDDFAPSESEAERIFDAHR